MNWSFFFTKNKVLVTSSDNGFKMKSAAPAWRHFTINTGESSVEQTKWVKKSLVLIYQNKIMIDLSLILLPVGTTLLIIPSFNRPTTVKSKSGHFEIEFIWHDSASINKSVEVVSLACCSLSSDIISPWVDFTITILNKYMRYFLVLNYFESNGFFFFTIWKYSM